MFNVRVGDRISAYTANPPGDTALPLPGCLEYDPSYNAFFVFKQNAMAAGSGNVIDATDAVVSLGANKSAYGVQWPAGQGDINFAGVRVPGAAPLDPGGEAGDGLGDWGWFQVSGLATFDGTSTANATVSINSDAGDVYANGDGVPTAIAIAQATVGSAGPVIAEILAPQLN